jgi:hypothetical protein
MFQDRILTDTERLALATVAAAHRWEDLSTAPVNPPMLLNPRRYGDDAKDLWTTLNTIQENITKGGQRDRAAAVLMVAKCRRAEQSKVSMRI